MRPARALAIAVSTALSLAAAEAAVRVVDGYRLFSLQLRKTDARLERDARQARDAARPDLRHLSAVALAAGVDRAWYELSPPEIRRFPVDAAMRARYERYPSDPWGAFFAFNSEYLKTALCSGNVTGALGLLSDYYVYDPVAPGPHPIYRHLPNASPPGWFVTNRFGWRGPDLTLERPANTIRIAFVGASTTIDSAPISHPELVGHWLNLWLASRRLPYRIEVINAGRTGIESSSIAAIVRQEVAPVDPDLVVYYEGANQFAPSEQLRMPAASLPRPTITFRKRSASEDYSAVVRRVLTAASLLSGGGGGEPAKPRYPTIWPPDVDERNPDVTHVPLPMSLDAVLRNFDAMRASLAGAGGELAVSSFIWLVYPGMVLDLTRHLTLHRYLNDTYWPSSYAHLRRMADFQNRLFASYAARYGLVFLDVAGDFPRDPDLFGDAIHMTQEGLRLQAWIYLQELVPVIDARIRAGSWPRPPRAVVAAGSRRDPSVYTPHLVSRNDILAQCH
jgi:hypothetical protein